MRNSESAHGRTMRDHSLNTAWDNRPDSATPNDARFIRFMNQKAAPYAEGVLSVEKFLAHTAFEVSSEFISHTQQTASTEQA